MHTISFFIKDFFRLTELEYYIFTIFQSGGCSPIRTNRGRSDKAIYKSDAVYCSSRFETQAGVDHIRW